MPLLPITHLDLMLASSAASAFSRPEWVFELKYVGFRCLKRAHHVRLMSRNGDDLAGSFPELVDELSRMRRDVAIDGELVVQDAMGMPKWEVLARRAMIKTPIAAKRAAARAPAAIFAFDLLAIGTRDLRKLPLIERKAELQGVLPDSRLVLYTNHIAGDGIGLYRKVDAMGLEGIVCKRADSPYVAGRSLTWMKVKTGAGRARGSKRIENCGG